LKTRLTAATVAEKSSVIIAKNTFSGETCVCSVTRSLVKLDELDAKERVARLLTVYEHQKKRRTAIKALSFLIPGSGQLYAGNILYGLLFLWPFLFFLSILAANTLFVTEMSGFSHLWLNVIGWRVLIHPVERHNEGGLQGWL
jgi:hypothetical protein